jgi:hypothetical protein
MTRTTLGIMVGLALGLSAAFGSFGQMLIVVAKVLDGQPDLGPYLGRWRDSR